MYGTESQSHRKLRVEGTSGDHLVPPHAKACSLTVGWTGNHLGRSWITLEKKTPQSLWATCSSALSPLKQVPVCAHSPLSCCWALYERTCKRPQVSQPFVIRKMHLIIFATLLRSLARRSLLFLNWEPRTGDSTPDVASPGQTREPDGHVLYNAPQNSIGLLGHRAHCWLITNLLFTRVPRFFSEEHLFSRASPNLYWFMWLFLPRCRTLHLSLLNLIRFLHPALQSVQVLLNGSTAFWCATSFSQLHIMSNLADSAVHPFILVIDEDVK